MKIIHTSDWHLGLALHGVSLIEEQRLFIEQFSNMVLEENADIVIIAGDIFDRAAASVEAIHLYGQAVTKICNELGVPVLICAGNHDGAARLSSCKELLKKSGLFVAGRIEEKMEPFIMKDVAIHLLPYFSLDEVRYLVHEEIKTYGDGMAIMINKIKDNFIKGKKNLLVAHCFVAGAETSESDRSAVVGGSSMVPIELFKDFDYVALGHLHRGQNMASHIRYSGTPLKYSFSEVNHEKSVTLLDTENMSQREMKVIPKRDVRMISGTYEDVMENSKMEAGRDDYMKIELFDQFAGLDRIATLRQVYPNLLTLIGKPMEIEGQSSAITVEELHQLSPANLLEKFCHETRAFTLDEELFSWFQEALSAIEEDGDAQ